MFLTNRRVLTLLGLAAAAGGSLASAPVQAEPNVSSSALIAQALSPGEQANADFQDALSGSTLLSALKDGGYVFTSVTPPQTGTMPTRPTRA